jgi:glycosidase
MLWRELRYDEDFGHPSGAARKPEAVKLDEELLRHYQVLGKARSAQPALRRGSMQTLIADEARRVYAFARVLDEERVVAAFNLTEKDQLLDLPFPVDQSKDLLSGRKLKGREGRVSLVLPALSAALVVADAPKTP